VCLLVLHASTVVFAQTPVPDPHDAQPQRPTVATHAWTVAPGWLEVEAGTEFDRYSDRSRGALVPFDVKIGLAPRVQFEVLLPIVEAPGPERAAVGDLALGVKCRLLERKPIVGSLAVFPTIKLPTASSAAAGSGTTDVGAILISSHAIGSMALDLNMGYTRRSGDGTIAPRAASVWTVSFGGPAAGPVGWVAELYGFPATSGPAGDASIVAVLVGPTFKVRPWFVLDVGVIAPITGPQPRAIYGGVVYNIGQLWR
jgi:hypothetical protein